MYKDKLEHARTQSGSRSGKSTKELQDQLKREAREWTDRQNERKRQIQKATGQDLTREGFMAATNSSSAKRAKAKMDNTAKEITRRGATPEYDDKKRTYTAPKVPKAKKKTTPKSVKVNKDLSKKLTKAISKSKPKRSETEKAIRRKMTEADTAVRNAKYDTKKAFGETGKAIGKRIKEVKEAPGKFAKAYKKAVKSEIKRTSKGVKNTIKGIDKAIAREISGEGPKARRAKRDAEIKKMAKSYKQRKKVANKIGGILAKSTVGTAKYYKRALYEKSIQEQAKRKTKRRWGYTNGKPNGKKKAGDSKNGKSKGKGLFGLFHNDFQHGDILEHYGVKGMHWGSRKGKRIAARVNKTEGTGVRSWAMGHARSVGNSIAHPFISTGVRAKNASMHPVLTATSPWMMRKKNNQEIRQEVTRLKQDRQDAKRDKYAIKEDKLRTKAAMKKYGTERRLEAKESLRGRIEDIKVGRNDNVNNTSLSEAKKRYKDTFREVKGRDSVGESIKNYSSKVGKKAKNKASNVKKRIKTRLNSATKNVW